MKRVVLYTYDLEPITVIELPDFAWAYLKETRRVQLAVVSPPCLTPWTESIGMQEFRVVNLNAELLRRQDHETLMLFTADEESALLLKPAFLPGQRRAVQQERQSGMAEGFLRAIQALGGGYGN